jgi:O-antigen/teichoic acid export membrane protein
MDNSEIGNAARPSGLAAAVAVSRFASSIRPLLSDHAVRALVKGVAWTGAAAAVDRLVGLAQAYYVARLLGVELFGKYGLLFTTIGLISVVTGLQLGLTATVQISRYRSSRPDRAAAMMRLSELTTLGFSVVTLAAISVAPDRIAGWLLDSAYGGEVIVAAAFIALFAVVGGVQESILQAFEQFALLSFVRVGSSLLGIMLLLAMSRSRDLTSVISAIAFAGIARTLLLFLLKELTVRKLGLRTRLREIGKCAHIIMDFSIPSLLISLISGFAQWYGLLLVKAGGGGFSDIAFLTTGQQWRSAVTFATTILASVAIPMMSRLLSSGDVEAIRRIHRLNATANVVASAAVIVIVLSAINPLLAAYGEGFENGRLPFALVLVTTLPAAYVVVMQNFLISQGRVLAVLGQTSLQSAMQIVAYLIVVPLYGVAGFAVATLVVTSASALTFHVWISSMELRVGAPA